MAVMITLTLKMDAATYQGVHEGLIGAARSGGLLFHSGHEVAGGIAVVDFWPSAEAFQQFMEGPAGMALSASGVPSPDDVQITPVLTADKG